jgi:tRNA dimethylallyltransferase
MNVAAQPMVVAIMGPTASGKTAAALHIATKIPCEIISVDSALVYRDMNIGTAKPSAEELSAVTHHLINIIDPTQSYSVMQFRQDALRLVGEITARGKLPLLVGGTMLYFKALRDGLDELPQADPALRAKLDEEIALHGIAALHARLRTLDPITAERLKPHDTQRIQRAMEIIALTGQPMSSLLARAEKVSLPFTMMAFALEPSVRSVLHQRIADRFDQMLNAQPGLLDEVRLLRERGDLHAGLPSMRCVGYRQAWEYLDGQIDLTTLRETGIAATRQLAKRQLTWLRSMHDRISIDSLGADPASQILEKVQAGLG